MFLVVSGNMGSGKTTLTRLLAHELDATPHFESVDDNPFLERTWNDRKRWVFALQAYYLAHRHETHRAITNAIAAAGAMTEPRARGKEMAAAPAISVTTPRANEPVASRHIQDRSIYEGLAVFVEYFHSVGQMDPDEYRTYRRLHEGLIAALTPPDLVIYVRCPLDRLQRQIAERGREFESRVSPDLLGGLNQRYEEWFTNYAHGPKLALESADLDFRDDPAALAGIVDKVRAQLTPHCE